MNILRKFVDRLFGIEYVTVGKINNRCYEVAIPQRDEPHYAFEYFQSRWGAVRFAKMIVASRLLWRYKRV